LFGGQKQPVVPVVNPADTQNRINDALARRLQAGGSNADQTSSQTAPTGPGHLPTLTGLN
jgi:hypothetical protein